VDNLKRMIREIPDFPKPGINFYDITTLLKNPYGFRTTIDRLTEMVGDGEARIDTVVGMEARGFIFAPALAYRLGAGFVPIRKPKKLPGETERVEYDLEYGTDVLEIHKDAIGKGHRVLIADDLLATGGTAKAVVDLVERLGGEVVACAFVIELTFLGGRERLKPHKVSSLLQYES
jgi:adenine phosphoribosyltransferase